MVIGCCHCCPVPKFPFFLPSKSPFSIYFLRCAASTNYDESKLRRITLGGDARINAAFADKIKPQRVTVIIKKKGKDSVHRQILIYFPYQNGKWGTNKSQFPTEMRDRLIQPQKRKKKSDKRPRRKGKEKKNVLCFTVRLDTTHRLGQVHFLA